MDEYTIYDNIYIYTNDQTHTHRAKAMRDIFIKNLFFGFDGPFFMLVRVCDIIGRSKILSSSDERMKMKDDDERWITLQLFLQLIFFIIAYSFFTFILVVNLKYTIQLYSSALSTQHHFNFSFTLYSFTLYSLQLYSFSLQL